MVKTIFLLRHAEAESNKQKYFGGWTNDSLTKLGEQQASVLGRRLLKENIGRVFSSDLRRAKDTFSAIGLKCPVSYHAELREKNYGSAQGNKWTESYEDHIAHTDPFHRFEGGESAEEVQKRVVNFFDSKVFSSKEKKVLVVSHHTPIITLADHLLGIDLHNWRALRVGNCGLSIFVKQEGLWRLSLWNSLSHWGLRNYKPLFTEKD